MRTRITGIAATGMVVAMLASSCIGGGGSNTNVLLVASVVGAVQARDGDGGWRNVAEGQELAAGARIRVAPQGSVTLHRGEESVIELRPTGQTPAELTVRSAELVSVTTGDVLVESSKVAPVAVESGGISARSDEGVFRFDRRLSLRLGVYEGSAQLVSPSAELPVQSLREGVVTARLLPRRTEPLQYNSNDPWDARFLADVISLDEELAAQRRGYEAAFGKRTTVAELDRYFATGLGIGSLGFTRSRLATTGHGDIVIGLVLAALAEKAGGADAVVLFDALMDQRAEGATWGILARGFGIPNGAFKGVSTEDFLSGVALAVGLRTGDVRATPGGITGGSGTNGGGGGGGGGGGTGSPSPTPTRTRSPSPTPTPTNTSSPSPSPSPTPSPSESPCTPGPPPLCVPTV